MGRQLSLLLTFAALCVARAPHLAAQALVSGFVGADSTERAIWNADVLADSGTIRSRTSVDGRFFLRGLGPGRHHVLARAIGFKPITIEIDLADHDTLELDIRLTRLVQQLAPVTVEGKVDRVSGKMAEFDRRRATGFGKFVDRIELAKLDPLPLSDVLRRLAGVQLRVRPWRCGGGFAVATSRGGTQRPHSCDPMIDYSPACYLTVFLDGARVYTPPDPDPPNIDELTAAGLEGIEVFRGSGEMPAELGGTGSPCGAIVLWTRTGEDRRR